MDESIVPLTFDPPTCVDDTPTTLGCRERVTVITGSTPTDEVSLAGLAVHLSLNMAAMLVTTVVYSLKLSDGVVAPYEYTREACLLNSPVSMSTGLSTERTPVCHTGSTVSGVRVRFPLTETAWNGDGALAHVAVHQTRLAAESCSVRQ